jgi:hypothetical protein
MYWIAGFSMPINLEYDIITTYQEIFVNLMTFIMKKTETGRFNEISLHSTTTTTTTYKNN